MSYRQIRDEILGELAALPESVEDIGRTLHVPTMTVFKRHIAAGNLSGLVLFAVENFDTNCGDEYLLPLSAALVEAHDLRSLRRLWKGIIANRRRHYFASISNRSTGTEKLQSQLTGWKSALRDYSSALRRCGEHELAADVDRDLEEVAAGRVAQRPSRPTDKRPMDEDLFWRLIEETRPLDGSGSEHLIALQAALSAFGKRALRSFQRILLQQRERANRWDLWGVAFILRGGCSDDAFDSFRSRLVLQGRKGFESILAAPSRVVEHLDGGDLGCEGLLWVAEDAFELAHDAPMPPVACKAKEPAGEPWREEQLPTLFPELWSRTHG